MDTEETRTLIEEYYATLPTGDREKLASMLTEDVEWRPAESVPIKPLQGRRPVSSAVSGRGREQIFDMETYKLTVRKKVVDGDTAVVQQAISARTVDGKQYDNEYCWVYTCRDGQIARIVEYVDTRKAAQIFGWP
jgi:ketosteroid isomerase-like protein